MFTSLPAPMICVGGYLRRGSAGRCDAEPCRIVAGARLQDCFVPPQNAGFVFDALAENEAAEAGALDRKPSSILLSSCFPALAWRGLTCDKTKLQFQCCLTYHQAVSHSPTQPYQTECGGVVVGLGTRGISCDPRLRMNFHDACLAHVSAIQRA